MDEIVSTQLLTIKLNDLQEKASHPTQNNGLESTNLVMKNSHTLRERMMVGLYLNNAKLMMRNMSLDRVEGCKAYKRTMKIDDKTWHFTYEFIYKNDKAYVKQIEQSNRYVVSSNSDLVAMNLGFLMDKYEVAIAYDFEQWSNYIKHVHIVNFIKWSV